MLKTSTLRYTYRQYKSQWSVTKGSMRFQIRRSRFDVKHIAVLSLFLLTSIIAPFYAYSALALSAPVLSEPSDIFFIKGQSTLCRSWHSISGVNRYNYQSYNDKELTRMRVSSNLTDTSLCTLVTGNFEFWWRVRAIDAGGNPGESFSRPSRANLCLACTL